MTKSMKSEKTIVIHGNVYFRRNTLYFEGPGLKVTGLLAFMLGEEYNERLTYGLTLYDPSSEIIVLGEEEIDKLQDEQRRIKVDSEISFQFPPQNKTKTNFEALGNPPKSPKIELIIDIIAHAFKDRIVELCANKDMPWIPYDLGVAGNENLVLNSRIKNQREVINILCESLPNTYLEENDTDLVFNVLNGNVYSQFIKWRGPATKLILFLNNCLRFELIEWPNTMLKGLSKLNYLEPKDKIEKEKFSGWVKTFVRSSFKLWNSSNEVFETIDKDTISGIVSNAFREGKSTKDTTMKAFEKAVASIEN